MKIPIPKISKNIVIIDDDIIITIVLFFIPQVLRVCKIFLNIDFKLGPKLNVFCVVFIFFAKVCKRII